MTPSQLSVLPPLPPGLYLRRSRAVLPYPLEESGCRLFSRARHGLFHGARALGLGPGDAVLAPAYHHGSEVEALERAGVRCRFYDLLPDLTPDPDELERLLAPDVRGLYLIHYAGFPQDAAAWRRWCDERRLLLLEDAAQSWLASLDGRPLGSFGDLAVICLYKTFGLPDGAALVCSKPAVAAGRGAPTGLGLLARRHGRWIVARSGAAAAVGSRIRRPKVYSHEADLALGDPDAVPSRATRFVLPRVVEEGVDARRRSNFSFLLAELGELVPEPFRTLPEGASPHAFPVEASSGETLLRVLAEHGIKGFRFWTHPHPSLPAGDFPVAASCRARFVVLPCHQELRHADLVRIVRAVRAARPQSLEPLARQRPAATSA